MARKGKAMLPAAAGKAPSTPEERKALSEELKKSGNERFAKREFAKALQYYDQALRLVPDTTTERAVLHHNKAACHFKGLRYKECEKECTNALVADKDFVKARVRRAKAYEHLGKYQEALEDYKYINANAETRTEESVKKEKELDGLASGKLADPSKVRSAKAQQPRAAKHEIRLVCGGDTRVVLFHNGMTYAVLLDEAKTKFPDKWPFKLTYRDRADDVITMTSVSDVGKLLETEMARALASASGEGKGPKLSSGGGVIATVTVEKVGSEGEVPPPPDQERSSLEQQKKYVQMLERVTMEKAEAHREAQRQAALQRTEIVEIDNWLVQMTGLIKDQLGIDPDSYVELTHEGYEKVTAAADRAMNSDKAIPVYHEAIDKFKEGAAQCIMQWGGVHAKIAAKHVDDLSRAGVDAKKLTTHEKYKLAIKEFEEAEKRVQESFTYKPDFYDGAFQMAQVLFEKAKLAAGLLVPNPNTSPEAAEEAAAAGEAGKQNDAYEKALGRLLAQNVEGAMPLFQKAIEWFEKSIAFLPEEQRNEDLRAKKADDVTFKGQTLIMSGNVMYEVSQVKSATKAADWKDWLKRAVDSFLQSGAAIEDIRAALKNHLMKDQVEDLMPPSPSDAKKPKGLPALKKK